MSDKAFARIAVPDRAAKPRAVGVTMVADWGLGLRAQADLLDSADEYVDLAKIAVGISRLLSADFLRQKIDLYGQHQVAAFPGGQFLEYAHYHGQTELYFEEVREAGLGWVEVSDNVIHITPDEKTGLIRMAREQFGLKVLGEAGSKVTGTSARSLIADIQRCLDAGSWKVFVEAAELFNNQLNQALVTELVNAIPIERMLFEIPGPWIAGVHACDQHAMRAWLIRTFGPDVNLANVPPADVLEVETMRRGIGVAALQW